MVIYLKQKSFLLKTLAMTLRLVILARNWICNSPGLRTAVGEKAVQMIGPRGLLALWRVWLWNMDYRVLKRFKLLMGGKE